MTSYGIYIGSIYWFILTKTTGISKEDKIRKEDKIVAVVKLTPARSM